MEKTTDYPPVVGQVIGNFVYQNSSLKMIITDDGRLLPDSTGFAYEYFIKDHLGNTRVVVGDNEGVAEVMQESHYYPFGMRMEGQSYTNPLKAAANKYLYNGKELQDDLGLGLYDYGARYYDPVLGRWHSIDPMVEFYSNSSAYCYVENNPISFIDPNGMFKSKFGAWWHKLWNGGDGIGKDKGGEHFVYTDKPNEKEWGVTSTRVFDRNGRSEGKDLELEAQAEDYVENMDFNSWQQDKLDKGVLQNYDNRYDAVMSWSSLATSLIMPNLLKYASSISTTNKVVPKNVGAMGSKLISTYKSFTKSNYRYNLKILTGKSGFLQDAHHVYPQATRFLPHWRRIGLNIHKPQNLRWWNKFSHKSSARAYNKAWDGFFDRLPNANMQQIQNFGNSLMKQNGF